MVNFLVSIIVVGIIGWLAILIMRTNAQLGLLLNIVEEDRRRIRGQ